MVVMAELLSPSLRTHLQHRRREGGNRLQSRGGCEVTLPA